MPVSHLPLPAVLADSKYDPERERQHLNASRDMEQKLAALIDILNRYPPTTIWDARGQVIEVLGRRIGLGGLGSTAPLQLMPGDAPDKIRVTYGTWNNTHADGMNPSDTPPFQITVSGEGTLWAKLNLDITKAESITSVELMVNPGDTANTLSAVWQYMGSWGWSDGAVDGINSNLSGSQSVLIGASATEAAPVSYIFPS